MVDIEERIQRAVEEIAGNEALLEMLDTDAAEEMLDWGKAQAAFIIRKTIGMDDLEAEQATLPRLKALRQTIRAVGNWAAGKYADQTTRLQLREKLLENFRVIFGDESDPPTADQMDELINKADDKSNSMYDLILDWKELMSAHQTGDSDHVAKT